MNNKSKPTNKKEIKLSKKDLIIKVSLIFNFLTITAIVAISVANAFHVFDYAIVNKGVNTMCSSNFRDNAYSNLEDVTERKRAIASVIDYPCAQNGADTYYRDGVDKYLESLDLPKFE